MNKGINAAGQTVPLDSLVGVFVTAKLKGQIDPRQGWIIEAEPLRIQGESGTIYECEGIAVVVLNPPRINPNAEHDTRHD